MSITARNPGATAPIFIIALLLLLGVAPAGALERDRYVMEILVDGVTVQELAARGKSYVEALEGREYSIRLTNRTAARVAIALAVDGLNTIDARKTSATEAAKWILAPYGTITVSGWQTGGATARRFFFTTEARSYGSWLGQTDDLGLVSAAVFRERRPAPVALDAPGNKRRRLAAAAPAPTGARAREESEGAGIEGRSGDAARPAPPTDDLAATGIGREYAHRVRRVSFEAEAAPAARLALRYEYRDALVRLGVLTESYGFEDPLARRERARGFDGFRFAPDPFAPRR